MPVYSDKAILEALGNGILSIEPLHPNNIQPASIDLTLGGKVETLLPGEIDLASPDMEDIKQRTQTHDIRSGYRLEPNTYVVGYTAEYLKFSTFINGRIDTRNSLARCGLDLSAGSYINPGFEGHMPLVIRNFGSSSLVLHPGIRICQLEIFMLTEQSIRNYDNRHDLSKLASYASGNTFQDAFQSDVSGDNPLAKFLDERIAAVAKERWM